MDATVNTYVNRCPMCLAPNSPAAIRKVLSIGLGNGCTVVVCDGCGHLVVVAETRGGTAIETSKVPRDWFCENFTPADRKAIREAQEAVHELLGQWG